ncbi:unnamed protein product [Acanthoscelides obtectus]|uniref:Uncharacterized protein n=1 Tax=Acanthoscelides obtectus TaxID=200917 RepID=A0A9P0M1T4_ACAOB|nr:unnamed protein product [Acanthoscelides obtectus]CAK1619867.1 hypothetical protein AOBTE_LOCUS43 [Acanthoscelides obtectus]
MLCILKRSPGCDLSRNVWSSLNRISKYSKTPRHLGVTLDRKLAFKQHISKIAAKLKTGNNIPQKFLNTARLPKRFKVLLQNVQNQRLCIDEDIADLDNNGYILGNLYLD